jgi:hypothetical protein
LGLDPEHPGFLLGTNLPWLDYGCDFGANAWQPEGGVARPERRQRLGEAFGILAGQGLRWVRWFMLCDGRAGLRLAADGAPAGLDDRFFADADAALGLAADHGLRLMLVLFDFHWFKPAEWVNGVQLGGRGHFVAHAERRAALLEEVIAPILDRYGRHPAVWAWDVVNEPEWATRRTLSGRRGVSPRAMRHLIRQLVAGVRRHSEHRVTAGLVGVRGLDLLRGVGLDFYQFHWYDSVQDQVPLDVPVATLGLDGPVLLGEFPTIRSARPPGAIVDAARRGGYAGALAWSLLSADTASDPGRSVPTLTSLARAGGASAPRARPRERHAASTAGAARASSQSGENALSRPSRRR